MNWDWFTVLFGALVPHENASPKAQYAWRVRIGFVACGTCVLFFFSQAIAFGLFPSISGGFAKAQHVNEIAADMKNGQAKILIQLEDRDLFMLRVRHCNARTAEEKQLFWGQIETQMSERARIAGRPYDLPPCDSVQASAP